MGFTPAELAEMARADAEIEATFRLTNEEIAFGRAFDRDSILENMDARSRKIAEGQRRYREANKDKIAEGQRRYREANKDKIAEGKRRYYEANKDKIAEGQRRYREANKDKIAEGQRRYYEANKDKIAEGQRRYYEANKDKIAEGKQAIHRLRTHLGLSQKKFGELFGVTQVTVSHWENIKEPENWREIVAAYGGEIQYGTS